MQRAFVILLGLSILILAVIPAQADYFPPACVPNPQITFGQNGASTGLTFNPGLSINCPRMDYATPHMEHPEEMGWIVFRVEHQLRVGQTDSWVTNIVAGPFLVASNEIADAPGPFYNLGSGIDITGASLATHNRYRIVAEVSGAYAVFSGPPYHATGDFLDTFYGSWVDGPTTVIVAEPFNNRPDEWAAPQRGNLAPANGLQSR